MCGRYGFSVKNLSEVYSRFDVVNTLDDYTPRYNIAPGQMNPVITRNSPKKIQRMFWGLIPFWAKDRTMAFHTINARAEEISLKPSFRKSFESHRCLVPATGFYEWDKSTKPHNPYYFRIKGDKIFSFAGLFDIWTDPLDKKEHYSYTVITTSANSIVKPVHPRMPVILAKENEETWLEPDFVTKDRLAELLRPYPENEMEVNQVSNKVNNINQDSPDLISPHQTNQEQEKLF
jgi:putative SOS response-associated peptidase YedK